MPEPGLLLPAALGGVATGGAYALLAAALALICGKLRLVDFSQSVGLLLAAFGLTFLVLSSGLDPVASLPFAAVLGLGAGVALQRGRTVLARDGRDPLIHWIALLVIAEFFALQQWGGALDPWRLTSYPVAFGFEFQPPRAIALFAGLLGCALLAQAIRRTAFGKAVRAVLATGQFPGTGSKDPIGVQGFGVACACLAIGACLLVPSNGVQVQTVGGFLPVVLGLAVLGARGHLRDALWGGLLIGLVEGVGRAGLGDEAGLLCVVAVALALLLGHTERLFASGGYFPSEPQQR